jgi:hypothetical protein
MEDNKEEEIKIDELLIKARNYEKVIQRNKEYHKNNPEKIKEIKVRYYYRQKEQNPDKYLDKLEKSRKYYQEVIKPKKILKAEESKQKKEEEKSIKQLERLEKNRLYYHQVVKPKKIKEKELLISNNNID